MRDRIVGLVCGVVGAAVIGIGAFWMSIPALILAAVLAVLPIALYVRGNDDASPQRPWHRRVVAVLIGAAAVAAVVSALRIAPLWPAVFILMGAGYYGLGILLLGKQRVVTPRRSSGQGRV
ncbi:hypothetical protein [Brevibacterium metallidurans]|uniref:Uncharacterized protein n=1 Tax=Brevibacterium metallidurans TaxID=1482676 RepID=A0ABP3CBN0_9MICO